MSVGSSGGRFFSHRHVALTSPCPNCHGWIVCVAGTIWLLMIDTGFSMQMRGMSASMSIRTNASASACSARFSLNQRAPETARCVQGGCAIIRSHDSPSTSRTSP
jgi:hypothetical protein